MFQVIIFWIFQLTKYLIIARVLLSWMPINISYKIKQSVYELTEPLLSPIRKLIPPSKLGIDLSPIIVIIFLQILQSIFI